MYSDPMAVRAVLSEDGNTDDYDTPAHYSDEQIIDAIKRADARVDMYLCARYTVPVAGDQPLLRDFSSVLAAYFLTLTQSNNQDVAADDPLRLRAAEVMQALKDISNGIVILPFPEETGELGDAYVYNRLSGDLFLVEEFISPTPYNLPTHGCGHSYDGTRCDCA